MNHPLIHRLIPFVFVLLWSTGFISAKYALPYADPFQVLAIRMILNVLVFAALIIILNRQWLTPAQTRQQMITGLLVHGAYLGGAFAAMHGNMPAGLTALIVGLQPLLTALLAWGFLEQALTRRQVWGLLLGLFGVAVVLIGNGQLSVAAVTEAGAGIQSWAYIAVIVALLGISLGTIYQKQRGQQVDLVTGSFWQYVATACLMTALSLQFETREIDWQWPLILSLIWLVFGLSVAAVLLLLYMIRTQESAKAASYFYLVPPVVAIEAWFLFGEQFSGVAMLGILLVLWGVYWVTRRE